MCLGENKGFHPFGPGNSDERAGGSSSLFTDFHALSIGIKTMDGEPFLIFRNVFVIVYLSLLGL